MKIKKIFNNSEFEKYVLRFNKGEKVIENLALFHKKYVQSKLCQVEGIGAIINPTVGYLKGGEYLPKKITGYFELLTLKGNITNKENISFPHIHISFSDIDMNVYGGHLIETTTGATMEIFITVYDTCINRKHDDETNLFLLDI